MPKITIVPHEKLCPNGAILDAKDGDRLIDVALSNGIEIEHACEKSCACTTCHVIIRKGYQSLETAEDLEEDLLDRAWGLTPQSRLSCQVFVGKEDLEVEIPKYTVNQISEGK